MGRIRRTVHGLAERRVRRVATLVAVLAGTPALVTGTELERGVVRVSGLERTFAYHLPANPPADAATRLPIVLAFHGRLGTGEGMAKLTGLDAVADREPFVVVYPDGYERSWNDSRDFSPASRAGVDDLGFFDALVRVFRDEHHADPGRVYVTGISNGGFFALELLCHRADRVAGVAPVAAQLSEQLAASCAPARAVPVIFFLGTEDPLVPFAGGGVAGGRNGRVLSAADTMARLAALLHCGAPVSEEASADAPDGTRVARERRTCAGGTELALVAIHGGGHTWPGGWAYAPEMLVGKTSRAVSASDALWTFFRGATSSATFPGRGP